MNTAKGEIRCTDDDGNHTPEQPCERLTPAQRTLLENIQKAVAPLHAALYEQADEIERLRADLARTLEALRALYEATGGSFHRQTPGMADCYDCDEEWPCVHGRAGAVLASVSYPENEEGK